MPRSLAAVVVGLVQWSCAAEPIAVTTPPTEPPPTAETPVSNEFSSNALLLAEVRQRLISMLPPEGNLAVLVQLGQGAAAERAKADLVASLRDEPRISWSQVTSQPGGPVEDPANPGAHTNSVQHRIEPPPQLVLLVNESEGRLQMAARAPGPDPLGPATDGWTWVLIGP